MYASNSPPANSLRSALCTQSTALNAEGQVNIEMGRNVPTASTYHNHDDHVDASDDRKSPLLKYIFLYVSFDIFLCIYLSLYVSLKKKEEEKSDLRKHLDCFVIVFGFLCDFFYFSNALYNHYTVAWVTRPERPKGEKDEVKKAQRAKSGSKGQKPARRAAT